MASKQFEINLNDNVQVRLTPAGEIAWAEAWRVTSPDGVPPSIRAAADKGDGWFQFQWHELMNTFGPMCCMGSNGLPFKTNMRVVLDGE